MNWYCVGFRFNVNSWGPDHNRGEQKEDAYWNQRNYLQDFSVMDKVFSLIN